METITCPNLIEWTGWPISFCKLRHEKLDILNSHEIRENCKNESYTNCLFFSKNIKKQRTINEYG